MTITRRKLSVILGLTVLMALILSVSITRAFSQASAGPGRTGMQLVLRPSSCPRNQVVRTTVERLQKGYTTVVPWIYIESDKARHRILYWSGLTARTPPPKDYGVYHRNMKSTAQAAILAHHMRFRVPKDITRGSYRVGWTPFIGPPALRADG